MYKVLSENQKRLICAWQLGFASDEGLHNSEMLCTDLL